MSSKCFYEKGLRFECQQCRYCCSVEPGFVYLSDEEINSMASYLGMDRDSFVETYCRKIGDPSFYRISLKEKDNFDCIFLTKKGCIVYEVRPKQCRTYPFWKSVCESQETWDNEAKFCPGINKGTLHTKEEIKKLLKS